MLSVVMDTDETGSETRGESLQAVGGLFPTEPGGVLRRKRNIRIPTQHKQTERMWNPRKAHRSHPKPWPPNPSSSTRTRSRPTGLTVAIKPQSECSTVIPHAAVRRP